MPILFKFERPRSILFCLFVLAAFTAVFVLPFQMRSNAIMESATSRPKSQFPMVPNTVCTTCLSLAVNQAMKSLSPRRIG